MPLSFQFTFSPFLVDPGEERGGSKILALTLVHPGFKSCLSHLCKCLTTGIVFALIFQMRIDVDNQ